MGLTRSPLDAVMARNLTRFLVWFLAISICGAAPIFEPISDSHRSAATELFKLTDASFGSLQVTYEALRVMEILAIENKPDRSKTTCRTVLENVGSSSSSLKDLFYALKVNGFLKCGVKNEALKDTASRLKAVLNDASSLLDLYYAVGSSVLVKKQASNIDVLLADADGVFQSIKALSQSDGRWRYSSNNPESSTHAAGLALEALSGVVALASSEIHQSKINTVKNDVLKLFDSIEKYDDGTFYFDEKNFGDELPGPLITSAAVVRGITAFASVTSERLNIPGDKILGLAKFFLGIGMPGNAKDFFYQLDPLACLENNKVSIPLILSLPATVLSLTRKDQLKVKVNTVLGSVAPPLTVKLVRAISTGSKGASVIENKDLKFDRKNGVHILDVLPKSVDVGSYDFVFEMVLQDSNNEHAYATGGQIHLPIYVTGIIKVDQSEIAVLDSDLGSVETQKKLDLAGGDSVSLSANHLQKLRISFQLTTPRGHSFKPHQAFLKLRHETKVDHVFVVGSTGKNFEIILDFLGLVDKFFYLSGKYEIQLAVGDAVMENSLLWPVGHVELDLPEAPEKATRPPPPPVDPYSRYGPKPEITHIFRAPEKRPPRELSLAFVALIFLPFIGFMLGLFRLGVNFKNFPIAPVPATYAILFHLGIAGVLFLYLLFWLELDLFTTLKALGVLGAFLMYVGHRILSHLASSSAKLKSA